MPPRKEGNYTILIKPGTRLFVNVEITGFIQGEEVTIISLKNEQMKMSNGTEMSWRFFLRMLKRGVFSITLIASY